MTNKQIEEAQKSLKWVVNQIPEDLCGSNEERMLKCIRLYCKNGAEVIGFLKAENERLNSSDKSKEDCTIEQHAERHRLRDDLKEIQQDSVKCVLLELLGFIGSNQKFCIVDDNHKNLIETDGLFSAIEKIAKKYGIKIEQ